VGETISAERSLRGRLADRIGRQILRARVHSRDFTIVSNNCWGAHIYQQLRIPYQTPFVGLFLAPTCYLTLIGRLRWFLAQPLRFVRESRHAAVNALRERQGLTYPIGSLGDEVEVQFLHYASEAEAAEKWKRRAQRVTSADSRLFFKFCDHGGINPRHLATFDAAPVAHKVCFVAQPAPQLKSAVLIPDTSDRHVPDGIALATISPRYFDAAGWINGADGRPRWWQVLRRA
jgi:uncharacterized protein (DUF1919 family)